MDEQRLRELLEDYRLGRVDGNAAVAELKRLPFEDLGYAKVDHHRALRSGFPEVIFCPGKTPQQITGIAEALLRGGSGNLLATRASREAYDAVRAAAPDAEYHAEAKLAIVRRRPPERVPVYPVLVVSAGTADHPVAEEAALTAELLGCRVERVYDAGVAGLHRLLAHTGQLQDAGVVIVVAGMEGALASVVGGLSHAPVIAVPTSAGYGASFQGLAALLAMLNSCAAGVTVCNIDNGFGAAWMANRILRVGER
jgi:NCAIR mutase (PurE)-related protein